MEVQLSFTSDIIPEKINFTVSLDETGIGSSIEFRGIVRGLENGIRIKALRYEVYKEMADAEIRRICRELNASYPCDRVMIIHRYGTIPVGECAICVQILSKGRQNGIRFLEKFMDQLKQTVPIWKAEAL